MLFKDRQQAGALLARKLEHLRGKDVLVLALPRGGVVVGHQIARAMQASLDVYIAHKIGAPFNEELAIGAVASDGTIVLDDVLIAQLGVTSSYLEREIERQKREIQRRLECYRGKKPPPAVEGRIVILVDDGVATGATTKAALRALRKQNPARLLLAVPVGPPEAIQRLEQEADQVICLATPEPFWAVGRFFLDWAQISDTQVVCLLEDAAKPARPGAGSSAD
ncbi:MAG: phosphoribosyltransferase [Chloroflexota bacterium]